MSSPQVDNLIEKGHNEIQVYFNHSKEIGTRFGENHITQNVLTNTTSLSLTMLKDKKIGDLTVNFSESTDIEELVSDGSLLTKFSQPNKEFPGFTEAKVPKAVLLPFQQKIQSLNIEKIADSVQLVINSAHEQDSKVKSVAGNINAFEDENVYVNSHGIELWFNKSKVSSVINLSPKITLSA